MKKQVFIYLFLFLLVLFGTNAVFAADLSVHEETEGNFSAAYSYKNPYKGKDTSKGVTIRFTAKPTGEIHTLGTIFALYGFKEQEGRLFFTPGSYLGLNIGKPFSTIFDANLFDYQLVTDYIKDGADMEISITPNGFSVKADGVLCYDESIFEDETRSMTNLPEEFSYSMVLDWIAQAETLYFGYGSFWNAAGFDEAYIELSDVFFELSDGTIAGSYFTENEKNEPAEVDVKDFDKVIDTSNSSLVAVDTLDLSFHAEATGNFTPVYTFDNPFLGASTKKGVVIEFTAESTGDVHALGTIFSIYGSGEYEGRLYFTPGSYLGYNNKVQNHFFDANLKDYILVEDFIGQKATIRIELSKTGFAVYADDKLCYDQTILSDPEKGSGEFDLETDMEELLDWLSHADKLYFGYGSWWNSTGYDEANIKLSKISFRLSTGKELAATSDFKVASVLLDAIAEHNAALEANETSNTDNSTVQNTNVKLTVKPSISSDWDDVEYQGESMVKTMSTAVIIVAVIALLLIVLCWRRKEYPFE